MKSSGSTLTLAPADSADEDVVEEAASEKGAAGTLGPGRAMQVAHVGETRTLVRHGFFLKKNPWP